MVGVPLPAKKRKAVESVVKIEPITATSDLNQRFSNKMMNNAASVAKIIDGNLIEYGFEKKVG